MGNKDKQLERQRSDSDARVSVEDATRPTFETSELRRLLSELLDRKVLDPLSKLEKKVGDYKWGVYAFYDYDGEPIYVGQTNERLRVRIRRHLTNQRTDAVAMNVLDPFEVYEVALWPLSQFENAKSDDPQARAHLNALEHAVFHEALKNSTFNAVLNEKAPPNPVVTVYPGAPMARDRIVSDAIREIRGHPDTRIARRATTLARLAQVISERQVKRGLRRTLLIQAKRLQWLAEQRLQSLQASGSATEDGDEN